MNRQTTLLLTLLMTWGLTPAAAQPEDLHGAYDKVLKTFVAEGRVDYAGLMKNRTPLDQYLDRMALVSENEFSTWPQKGRLAYLVNLYNAATLQLIIDHYPVKSIKDIGGFFKGPWHQPVVRLFGKKITLNNLEHDIIRKQFKEPRIHMALVCAARGCPPLRDEAYTAARLHEQLDEQSMVYLTSPMGMRIDRRSGKVYLSKIFKWYGEDFTSVTAFVEKHSAQKLDGLAVRWLDYDWTLND